MIKRTLKGGYNAGMGKMGKRGPGRPPKHGDAMMVKINIRMPQPMMDAIQGVVSSRKDGADTAQVIRELLAKALETEGLL